MIRVLALIALLAGAVGLTGCTHAQAKTTPDGPPLEMPAPPPRDVEPLDTEVPPPMPMPGEPTRRTPARRVAPPRENSPKIEPRPETPKPEPPTTETPKSEDPPKEPPKPPTTLQTTPAGSEGVVERSIRATLSRASGDLNHIDYRALNTDGRSQYDSAKRFVQQAEDAMRVKNLVFARNLADKAAALAAQLAGR